MAATPDRFPCPSCGSDMAFDPSSAALRCNSCKSTQPVAAPPPATPSDFEQALTGTPPAISETALELSCSSCGATVTFEPPYVAGQCPFCATQIVAQPKAASSLITPSAVLPFHLSGEQVNQQIRAWVNSRWFAPNSLKALATFDRLQGIYLPHWSYNANTYTHYRGQRGDAYFVTQVVTDQQGRRVEQQVRQVRWSATSGTVESSFERLLVLASKTVEPNRVTALTPWDLDKLSGYHPAYLAGFRAQRYQLDLPTGFNSAKEQMQPVINDMIRRDIGGDEQIINDSSTQYSNVAFEHLLLPVWLGAFRFNSKVYQVYVNARTGEVQGERPYSATKITFFVLSLLLTALILYLLNR